MSNLFEEEIKPVPEPLAERMRPMKLDDFAGQEHLVSKDKPIRKMIESGELTNMIFWGPPGSGKTTLAGIIANESTSDFNQLSAVNSGVKDVRTAIETAAYKLKKTGKRSILFIDEIHRFNKAQQDSLLNATEKGIIYLIGATTENPSFEVISPLLSRSRVYVLESLKKKDFMKILDAALSKDQFLLKYDIEIEDKDFLFSLSGGDARKLLNGLDLSVLLEERKDSKKLFISNEKLKEAFQVNYIKYDKNREEHYNIISAFIKSMRGSDPDAAVYWLARMIEGGEDPKFIARRLIILASEDIGNADPNALTVAVSAFTAVDYIGMPEASIVLSHAVTYLATAPKSNASYKAISNALDLVKNSEAYDVPLHLRNAPTKLMKDLDYGADYVYDHDYEDHFSGQDFLPQEIKDKKFYYPSEQGIEKEIRERLNRLRSQKK